MKTTLVIDDALMARVKKAAAREGRTISDLVEAALWTFLEQKKAPPPELPPLPSWNCGGFLVDISDRDALYDAMERDDEG